MKAKTSILVPYGAAQLAAWARPRNRITTPLPAGVTAPGISVVIPSRSGKDLLAAQLPGIVGDLPPAAEVVVVDNGSDDGTEEWLRQAWPRVRIESSREPLSFADAVNRGLAAARYAHVCLLNNDMLLNPGFFQALLRAFDEVPDLFCATAQIRFPPGVRREETGKAVMAQDRPEDFPLRCDDPLPGEDLTCVLYGSGGCSLYDAAKLRALGGVDRSYQPAYVEDLDLGFRAWQRGWPSVYVAGAGVEHRHRATTSRFYAQAELERILEINYLKFLARSVAAPSTFRRLWKQAVERLRLRAPHDQAARHALRHAAGIALQGGPSAESQIPEDEILALTSGSVWNFPGRKPASRPRILFVAPSPLVLGEQLRRAAADHDPILVTFTDVPQPPPSEVLESCVETLLVRAGAIPSFRAALRQTVRKWRPQEAELESGSMAPFAADCAPARVRLLS